MLVNGRPFRTIWLDSDGWSVWIIDQTQLPFAFETRRLTSIEEVAHAIRSMQVRGAPLIGVAAAYGLCLGLRNDPRTPGMQNAYDLLLGTRPTAVNLRWALDRMRDAILPVPAPDRVAAAYELAGRMAEEDVEVCQSIGRHGMRVIEKRFAQRGRPKQLNILTHCNAGWLATVDWGTALAPIFLAHEKGIPVHVWVDETRPRNQGYLTAWELAQQGIPHTVVVDNAGGYFMQRNLVDLCLVGTDRTTARGDVCNKVGTYLKALAAFDNNVPFYVAAPLSSIDRTIEDGVKEIPIEERSVGEVRNVRALVGGAVAEVTVVAGTSEVANPAFDVTPARYVTGLITEAGVVKATAAGISGAFSPNPPNPRSRA